MFGIAESLFTKNEKISNKEIESHQQNFPQQKIRAKILPQKQFAFAKKICYFKSKAQSKTRFQKLSARAGEFRIFKEEQ